MKRIGIVLMMLLSLTLVSAQRGEGGQRGGNEKGGQRMSTEERQEKELAELSKTLSLSSTQITEVKLIQDKLVKDIEAKRESMTEDSDRKAMREEMKALRTQYNKDIVALLNDEQKAKYKELTEQREEEMKQRQGQRGGQGQGQRGGQGGGQRGGGQRP